MLKPSSFPRDDWTQLKKINQLFVARAVHVDDYGAIGNGTTDDTTAVQSALTAAGGGMAVFTPGKDYLISTALTVPANTVLWMYGATITTSGTMWAFDLDNSNVSVYGGTIACGSDDTWLDNHGGFFCEGVLNGVGVAPTQITDLLFQDVTITGPGEHGIWIDLGADITIRNVTVTNGGYTGIFMYNSVRGRILDCLIDSMAGETTSGELNAYGIVISGVPNTGDQVRYPQSEDWLVEGNVVKNIPTWHGIGGKAIIEGKFIGNTVLNCRRGIWLSHSTDIASVRCSIIGNDIRNKLAGTETTSEGDSVHDAAIWDVGASGTVQSEGTVISGNTIEGHGPAGPGATSAIAIQNAKKGVCKDNTLLQPYLTGISLSEHCDDYVIDGNTIINPQGHGTGGSPAQGSNVMRGIHIRSADVVNCTISRNSLIVNDTSVNTQVGDDAILIDNVACSVHFVDNVFEGWTTNNFDILGSNPTLTGDIEGSFTGTWTGMTTSPTATIQYVISNGVATLTIPAQTGTSNGTSFTISGMPAWLQPTATQYCPVRVQDNSVQNWGVARPDTSGGTITFFLDVATATNTWTGSNTKGTWNNTITYQLVR